MLIKQNFLEKRPPFHNLSPICKKKFLGKNDYFWVWGNSFRWPQNLFFLLNLICDYVFLIITKKHMEYIIVGYSKIKWVPGFDWSTVDFYVYKNDGDIFETTEKNIYHKNTSTFCNAFWQVKKLW
jgi:hypothetical protein